MTKIAFPFALFSTVLVSVLSAPTAQAQATRTFVSAAGSDTNNCINVATPCRHFAAAYAATAVGGEIDVLDPANYGSLTIGHAVSIQGQGWAALSPGISGVAITINVPSTDAVNLSGLLIDGAGTGVVGIQFTGGASLTIENCVIRHVANDGIDFDPTGTSNLSISDSVISDNGLSGIAVGPTGSGPVTAAFNRVQLINNGYQGIYLEGDNGTGTLNATVSESVSERNAANGYYASSASGHATTTLSVFHSVSTNNVNGLVASGVGATVRAAQSMVTGNTHGWQALSNGVIQTYLDNYIDGNGTNSGNLTSISKQ
jgi:hypothetical protein